MTSIHQSDLRRSLRERLLSLNYHAFTWVMVHLLERLGYAEIRPVGRNNRGGYDLEAKLPFALGERKVIIQVKQYGEQMVFRRTVDELRGACLRTGASEGVILSTGPIAPSLSRKGSNSLVHQAVPGIAPIQLVDGDELLDLLMLHGIGIIRDDFSDPWLDETYFAGLERLHAGKGREGNEAAGGRQPHFLLTVGVQQLSGKHRKGRVTRMVL